MRRLKKMYEYTIHTIMPETALFVNSATSAGGRNKSVDGSGFDISFDQPLTVTGSPTIRCLQSTIFYTFPNVVNTNNELRISWFSLDAVNPTTVYNDHHQITFARGLYSVDDLNAVLRRELLSQGLASDTFQLVADNATQRVGARINAQAGIDGFTAEFTHADSTINSLLKFTKNESATRVQGKRVLMADGEAEFAPCSSVLLHCSLASGSYLNGS